jgi:hypothetical protein
MNLAFGPNVTNEIMSYIYLIYQKVSTCSTSAVLQEINNQRALKIQDISFTAATIRAVYLIAGLHPPGLALTPETLRTTIKETHCTIVFSEGH